MCPKIVQMIVLVDSAYLLLNELNSKEFKGDGNTALFDLNDDI